MNNNDLLCTNNLDNQYNINNQYNIINPILGKEDTIETQRENNILKKTIPNNIYTNDIYKKNNKIINYNDLANSNPILTDKDVEKSHNNNSLLNNINNRDNINNINDNYIKTRYQKIKKTKISIYSEDRNLELSVLPNNFDIQLNKTYKNIERITLKSIYFPNSIPILNDFNNRFTWQYPTLNNSNNIFIPDPSNNNLNKGILQDIEWDKILPTYNKDLIYSTKLNISYATTQDFSKEFTKQLSYSYHYQNYINYQNKYDLKCSDVNNNEFKTPDLSDNLILNNQSFNFDLDINTINHVVKLVNRIEKLPIYSIQIVKNNGPNNDILYNYSDTPSNILKKNRIYITIKESDYNDISMIDISNNNIFPLVITNSKNIDNISEDIINYTPFYNNYLYTSRYPTIYTANNPPESVSTFQYFDTIQLSDICGNTNNLVRLELALSNGNINGLYFNRNGNIIKTNSTQTIITNSWLKNYLNNLNPNIITSNDYFQQNEINNLPLIGRALPIKLINKIKSSDLYNTSNIHSTDLELNDDSNKLNSRNVTESVIDVLGWPNQHICKNGKNVSLKENYYFIQSNIDSFRLNTLTNLDSIELDMRNIFRYMSPQRKLKLENIDGMYYFRTIPFIYIKILPANDNIIIDNQLVRAYYQSNTINNTEYRKEVWNNLEKYNKTYYKPDSNNILAKVYLEPNPFKTTIVNDINSEYVFYNKPLETLEKLKIIITDPYGRILNIENDYSLTIEIQESINVLKNTLFDTRRGEIISTGIKK